ncbi:hypothetical protein [Tomitella biformata]|uniref:hypothetical protein n=1 Tax=Tomitella biformata TaxID=630403 RepID=UPI000467280F|nr:hypothetical protein [Tomitella biformata]
MTEKPEADRVITVAELLARHGQASGTAGRVHRRRAREGGISVAELTGEIPIIREPAPVAEPEAVHTAVEEVPDEALPADEDAPEAAPEEAPEEPADEAPEEPAADEPAEPRAYSALDAVSDAGPQSPREFGATSAFSSMTPLAGSIMTTAAPTEPEAAVDDEPSAAVSEKSPLRQWLALGAQAVVGVAVGAALFIGFERLWDSLPYVALVLALLVILAMVAVVRILRKTDDIVSILIAVVVGVIVTIGPLAFVLSTT